MKTHMKMYCPYSNCATIWIAKILRDGNGVFIDLDITNCPECNADGYADESYHGKYDALTGATVKE